ncbi:ankyrin repeat-containing domain protein [Mycena latifolia]|nr:ankyrin repeat-containing domain protein [Mycena latifolia]
MEPPSPPHAFSPFLHYIDESDMCYLDIWRSTGLEGTAYFAARNDAVPLIRASQSNDLAAVRKLISSPGLRIDEGGLERETALHMACALGYAQMVEVLIGASASVNATDHVGSTPLVHCTRFCSPSDSAKVVTMLLAAGANPLHIVGVDGAHYPPLWFSINAHNMPAVRLLAPLTPFGFLGSSAYHINHAAVHGALRNADTEILEFLIESGLPLKTGDLAMAAADDRTFYVLVQALGLSSTDVTQLGPQILFDTWHFNRDRRDVVPCIKRLVEHHQLDVNGDEVRMFTISTGSIDLLRASEALGLDLKSTPFDVVQSWNKKTSKEFKALLEEMCAKRVDK